MDNVNNNSRGRAGLYVLVALATLLIVAFVVKQMVKVSQPAPVGAERAAARAKDNADIRGAGATALASWGYVDQAKGVVRLPIAEAMKITVQGYQQPAAFRSNLTARLDKMFPPPVSYE